MKKSIVLSLANAGVVTGTAVGALVLMQVALSVPFVVSVAGGAFAGNLLFDKFVRPRLED